VTTSNSHAHRHQAQQGPPRSSSVRLLSPVRPPRSYEQQLEDRLEQMRLRAKRAEQELNTERARSHELMERMSEIQTTSSHELARVSTQAQQTTDSLKSRVRLVNGRCQQLTRDVQRLQEQQQLLQEQLGDKQRQQQQQIDEGQDECCRPRVERRLTSSRDAMTQTSPSPIEQLDLTTLYQLFTDITLTRLDLLEIDRHLPSRDQPPTYQRRRTTSLPANDVTADDDVTSSQQHDDVTMTSESARSRDSRHSSSLLNFDIFKKLRSDVINSTYKRPIRDRAPTDVITAAMTSSNAATSSFKRLQQRRNGLTDLSDFQRQSRDVVTSYTT